ncbi:DNA polymerase III, beta subunit [Chlorobaculum parvum NCIB 8327]|uniref:Beta sliding clamp n=1 Tax=Chlorobaculum parvum (strain DSM 263 / NCIMB 8327) TaxID=517417 RepID=B3QQY4_CHLP8|nr:DNA polymerase III subunit beta [Chlorobaculum parvum]ACF10431.1 DNA polymerase III, beta subunit [Chlorobaculum parvum NCIB 8327]
MKFNTTIKRLQEAVSKVILAVPTKSLDARFDNINMTLENGTLTMFATDGELSITAKCDVASSDKGTIAIRARTLQDFLRSMYDTEVTFEIERQSIGDLGTVHIATDKGRYRIPCTFISKPESLERNFDLTIGLQPSELQDIIQKTLFACSVDGMRPAMMGVLFEFEGTVITAVATDGHRLVRCRKQTTNEIAEKQKIVVPARVLSIIQRLLQNDEVSMTVDEERRNVKFKSENVELESALIVEPYPNYEAVIPVENEKKLVVDRGLIHDSVKRVGRFSSIGDLKISAEGELMKVMAENASEGESAQEELPCTFTGEEITIGFNAKFVEAALSHIETEQVSMEMSSPTTAVLFKPKYEERQDDLIILVMPVRINN